MAQQGDDDDWLLIFHFFNIISEKYQIPCYQCVYYYTMCIIYEKEINGVDNFVYQFKKQFSK